MKKGHDHPVLEPLESRLLFAAGASGSVDLALIKVVAPAAPIEISRHHVEGQLAAARIENLASSSIRSKLTVEFYLSADQTFSGDDVLVGRSVAHISLAAGASKGFTAELQPSPHIAGGKYYLFADLKLSPPNLNSNPAGNVAQAPARVSIRRVHGEGITANDAGADDDLVSVCTDTTDVSTSDSDNSSPDTQPAAESEPNAPSAPDSQSDPTTQSTSQPSDTQPSTDPASTDPTSSAPEIDSSTGVDSSSGNTDDSSDDGSDF